jgi:predicted ribosome quality control (RQC) complex YloA/Tae2 family protein
MPMDNFYLNEIVTELAPILIGRRLTRVALDGSDLRLDFGGTRLGLVARLAGYDPALFLVSDKRRKRDSIGSPPKTDQAQTHSAQQLLLQLRSKLVGAGVTAIDKDPQDRVVSLSMTASGFGVHDSGFRIILSLTGRSANVLLVGQSGLIEAAFKEAGPIQIGNTPPAPQPAHFDPQAVLSFVTGRELTSNEILDSYFGRSSPFTSLHRREFLCRSDLGSASKALLTLVEDLFKNKRKPVIYSSFPLDDAASRHVMEFDRPDGDSVIGQRGPRQDLGAAGSAGSGADIILSCIELTVASGMHRYEFASFSEAAEVYSESKAAAMARRERYTRLTSALETRLKKLRAALRSIQADLARFSEAETFKRSGDLLLANLNHARIEGTIAWVKDYYDSDQPEIEIEINEDQTLQQAAAAYYEKYQKARRAVKTLYPRAREIGNQISKTEDLLARLLQEPDLHLIEEAESLAGIAREIRPGARAGSGPRTPGAPIKSSRTRRNRGPEIGRRFLSSDGYEIVVGRNDSENDAITFRVAGSLDIWLHAADYPGSHVVVRNPSRQPVPQRSIIEAAQIAAFYSQARRQGKAAVNYTQRKFVSKPPKAKPGLVRLSGYKTMVVEPRIPSALDETNRTP